MSSAAIEHVRASLPRPSDRLGFHGTWREAATRNGFLPIFSDWVVGYALDHNGDVFYAESDQEWSSPSRLTNARQRHIVLAQAASTFPELSGLAPVRQPGDLLCPSCKGVGGTAEHPELICECGNLGWIPFGTSLDPRAA